MSNSICVWDYDLQAVRCRVFRDWYPVPQEITSELVSGERYASVRP